MRVSTNWFTCLRSRLTDRVEFFRFFAISDLLQTTRGLAICDAEAWGLWPIDPGPRGVRLSSYENLKSNNGIAPAKWIFNKSDWWLEEHGLIMEHPVFPILPGQYVVTGGRAAQAFLTIQPKGSDGKQHWALNNGATLYDVTHLGCRAANYTPASPNSCSPEHADQQNFPVFPGAVMPPVGGCNKQDYQVLIVVGMMVEE